MLCNKLVKNSTFTLINGATRLSPHPLFFMIDNDREFDAD